MILVRLLQIVTALYGIAILARLAAGGWRRRRPYWTAGSWWRFALTSALCLGVASLPVYPVVERLITGHPRFSQARALWTLTTLACMFVGVTGFTLLIVWFGSGKPDRQFPSSGPSTTRGTD